MPTLLDYLERAVTGTILPHKDFLMEVFIPNTGNILEEFGIEYDPQQPVSSDNALADRLFDAAKEFLARTGLYCEGTNRIIRFDRKKIEDGLKAYRSAGTFGENRDQRTLLPRKPEDKRLPWCHLGNGIVATSEEIAMALVEGFAAVPQAGLVAIPAMSTVRGMSITGGLQFNAVSFFPL